MLFITSPHDCCHISLPRRQLLLPSKTTKHYHMKILISVDSLESTKIILSEAYSFLNGFPDAELQIFTVLDIDAVSAVHSIDSMQTADFKRLSEEITKVATGILGDRPFSLYAEYSHPADMMPEKTKMLEWDLMVMSTDRLSRFDHLFNCLLYTSRCV